MTTPEIIAAGKDVILGLAAIFTAVAAVYGVNRWQRELKGRAAFESARNLIRATYKLRDAIQDCRSPIRWINEYAANNQESRPEEKAQALEHFYKNRYAPVSSAVQEFDACTLEAETLWGSEIRTQTGRLRQCEARLSNAINLEIRNAASGGKFFESDKYLREQVDGIVLDFSAETEENEFSKAIAAAIKAIEDQIRSHLRRG